MLMRRMRLPMNLRHKTRLMRLMILKTSMSMTMAISRLRVRSSCKIGLLLKILSLFKAKLKLLALLESSKRRKMTTTKKIITPMKSLSTRTWLRTPAVKIQSRSSSRSTLKSLSARLWMSVLRLMLMPPTKAATTAQGKRIALSRPSETRRVKEKLHSLTCR